MIELEARLTELRSLGRQSRTRLVSGYRLSRAEVFVYDHGDVEHLEWGLEQAEGRRALIVSESVFSRDGDVAPLHAVIALAERYRVRAVIDESHAIGARGPGGRGALAEQGLEDQLQERPRRVDKLAANAAALRTGLAQEGFDVHGSSTQIVPVVIGDAERTVRIGDAALARGVFAQAIRPPAVAPVTSRLRLTVMATHQHFDFEAPEPVRRAA